MDHLVLSSGEQSLKEKVLSDRGKWIPGMSVRFADIDVTDINSKVEKGFIDKILTGIQGNFGCSGSAFCRALIDSGLHLKPEELRLRVQAAAKNLAGDNGDGSLERAAMPLAMIQVAGELAQEYEILPQYDLAASIQWAWSSYLASADAASLDLTQNCIDALENYLASNWNVTIKDLRGEERSSREAVGWYDDNCIYIRATEIVAAVDIGLKRAEIARILHDF